MTSVPKPLKFLRPHYEELGKVREEWEEGLTEQRVSTLEIYRRTRVESWLTTCRSLYLLPFFPSSP